MGKPLPEYNSRVEKAAQIVLAGVDKHTLRRHPRTCLARAVARAAY